MIEITEELDRVAESYERDGMRYTASIIKRARKKITFSLSEADIALIEEIKELTGAYSSSEVVRNALRQAAQIAREQLERVWIAEGRDPKMFPKAAKITPEVLRWAEEVVRNHSAGQSAGD